MDGSSNLFLKLKYLRNLHLLCTNQLVTTLMTKGGWV
jgi:hypothetical protein